MSPGLFHWVAAGLTLLNLVLAYVNYSLVPSALPALAAGAVTMPVIWIIVGRLLSSCRSKTDAWRRKIVQAGGAGGFSITTALASKIWVEIGGLDWLLGP